MSSTLKETKRRTYQFDNKNWNFKYSFGLDYHQVILFSSISIANLCMTHFDVQNYLPAEFMFSKSKKCQSSGRSIE